MLPKWTTEDEIAFIGELAKRDPDLAISYCELIRSDSRRWDPTVDVAALERWIANFLRWEISNELPAAVIPVPARGARKPNADEQVGDWGDFQGDM